MKQIINLKYIDNHIELMPDLVLIKDLDGKYIHCNSRYLKFLEKDKVKFIATLPSRDVLLSQLLGMLNSPIVGLVSVLNNILVKPVLVLKQIGENKN